jgi:hypothetical protein
MVRGYGPPVMPATPQIVALDIAECAETYKPATIGLRLTAISHYHQAAGHESPTHGLAARRTLAGIRRSKGVAQTQKSALSVADLRQIVTEHLLTTIEAPSRRRALATVPCTAPLRPS